MRFDTSQNMRLGQQMKLGPRMIQSMEILQMPMMALQERIEQELEGNVALEQVEPGGDVETPSSEADDERLADTLDQRELTVGEDSRNDAEDWERLSVLESSYRDAFDNQYSSSRYRASSSGERDRKMDAMANVAARGDSLTEQLLHQWTFAEVEPPVLVAGEMIIGYIGKDGLLGADLETILEQNRNIPGLDISMELLEETLAEVQHWLAPAGLAARDTRESLLLQVDELESSTDDENGDPGGWADARVLISDHFDDLLQNRLPKIAQDTDLSLDRIQTAMDRMRKLNLSPGKDLVDEEVPPIIPDVIVEFDEESDEYIARHASGLLPALCVSSRYQKMAKDRREEKSTREFISQNVRNAQWLIDSIGQRKSTLLRVVNVVLARQRDYFDNGPQHLKPLPMIEVADQLGIHVGTVSRAVAEKWIQTPRGLVALRKFFSGGTRAQSGRDMSWDAIKATALAKALEEKGIEIARRTVVKYRQQLGIPPARRRKVFV